MKAALDFWTLTKAAISFSPGVDEKSDPAVEQSLLHSFVTFLKIVLDADTYYQSIPYDLKTSLKMRTDRHSENASGISRTWNLVSLLLKTG